MATLGNSRHNGIGAFLHTILTNVWNIHLCILAQLPMMREFFERFLHVAQSEDDDSDEQDMEHEAQNILPVLAQLSIGGVNLQYDNLQGDVPQAGLAIVGGVNTALGRVRPLLKSLLLNPHKAHPGTAPIFRIPLLILELVPLLYLMFQYRLHLCYSPLTFKRWPRVWDSSLYRPFPSVLVFGSPMSMY